MPAQRGAGHNPWVERIARRIDDPVRRLRFLQIAKPEIRDRPVGRWPGRKRLLLIPVLLAAALAVVLFVRSLAKAQAPISPIGSAEPAATQAPLQPAEVWLVEKTENSETYSNGLWIDNRYAVPNHPRSYLVFPADRNDGPPIRRSNPAGVVFHTTESLQAAFSPEQNGTLRRIGESLLDYVRRKRSYHFVIDRFGRVHRVVAESDAANHAGYSVWADDQWLYVDLNESFFGVSFEAQTGPREAGAGIDPAQVRAAAMLVEMLRSRYRIPAANCVTHAQVSVNPSNMQAGYHTDWAFGFPFEQLGLPDNYARDLPSLWVFGFQYAPGPAAASGMGVYAGAARTEERIRERASAAGMGPAAYRKSLQARFRQRFGEVRRAQSEYSEGSS